MRCRLRDARGAFDAESAPINNVTQEGLDSQVLLDRGADVNAVNVKGYAAIHTASEHHQVLNPTLLIYLPVIFQNCSAQQPPSRELGTCNTVTARSWPWLSGKTGVEVGSTSGVWCCPEGGAPNGLLHVRLVIAVVVRIFYGRASSLGSGLSSNPKLEQKPTQPGHLSGPVKGYLLARWITSSRGIGGRT